MARNHPELRNYILAELQVCLVQNSIGLGCEFDIFHAMLRLKSVIAYAVLSEE
jgi:hypothetical protein